MGLALDGLVNQAGHEAVCRMAQNSHEAGDVKAMGNFRPVHTRRL